MANAAVQVTIGQSLGGGAYSSSVKGFSRPDTATILTDITTALGAAGGSHDSTAEITTVQTDVTVLLGTLNADVVVMWNTTNVTTKNQLRHALQQALRAVDGSNLLT